MLKKTKIKICATIAAGLMGFAAIGTSAGIIANHNQIKTKYVKSVVNANKVKTTTTSKMKTTNYEQYLKDTSLNSVEKMIVQKVNQQSEMFFSLTKNQAKSLQHQNEVIVKAKVIAKKIMNGSINLNSLLKEIKQKYNDSFTQNEKDYINKRINEFEKENKLTTNRNSQFIALFSSSDNQSYQISVAKAKNAQNKVSSMAYELKVFAGLSTAAAIASTAIAATIWLIPFWGWVQVGFATADTVVDWISTGVAWAQYKNMNSAQMQMGNFIYNYLNTIPTALFLGADTWNFLNMFKSISPFLTKISVMMGVDIATNAAGAAAEPEVEMWLEPALLALGTALDITMTVMQAMSLY